MPKTLGTKTVHHRARDLTGFVSGLLTLRSPSGSRGGKTFWRAICACGNVVEVQASEVTRKRGSPKKSCGCATRTLIAASRRTHGMTGTPLYAVWRAMIDRCGLPSHRAWHNYGGRGIRVSSEWTRFEAFYADMGPTYRPGLTLDRRDNNGPYSKANCRWVTPEEQANNKRGNVTIATPRGPMTVARAARAFGLGVTTILYRIAAGWPESQLLIPPDFTNRVAA